jgi:hypothetical protein
VDIGTDATGATPQFDDDTNVGTNGGFGVRCVIAGHGASNRKLLRRVLLLGRLRESNLMRHDRDRRQGGFFNPPKLS